MAPHPLVELPVESHAQQVHGVLGGAVGLLAAAVLEVLQAEFGLLGAAGRRPDEPGRAVAITEQRLQLPDLHEEGGGNWRDPLGRGKTAAGSWHTRCRQWEAGRGGGARGGARTTWGPGRLGTSG